MYCYTNSLIIPNTSTPIWTGYWNMGLFCDGLTVFILHTYRWPWNFWKQRNQCYEENALNCPAIVLLVRLAILVHKVAEAVFPERMYICSLTERHSGKNIISSNYVSRDNQWNFYIPWQHMNSTEFPSAQKVRFRAEHAINYNTQTCKLIK